MFIQKLLSKFPFTKTIIEKREINKQINNIHYIKFFLITMDEGVYTTKELIRVENIVYTSSINLKTLQSMDKSTKVSFYSLSSQNALECVRKKQYYRETIANSNIINLFKTSLPLNSWLSGEESINYFIMFMKDMLTKSINLEQPNINREQLIKGIGVVTEEEEEFINSLLYKLLLNDFLSLIILLMENINVKARE